ncbi:MAG: thioredoxin fold domain-containing protein [Bacteroidetes bacterium]|nr:thioredoxin fold domain-containing protein [Bacteroidota bacterium]
MNSIKLFVLVITIIIFSKPAYSQFGLQNEIVKIKAYQSFDKTHPAGEFKIAIEADVEETWHINSNNPKDEFLIPTTVMIDDTINFNLLKIAYPEAHDIKLGFSDTPLSVWEGKVYFGGLVKAADNLLPGKYPLVISVEYQACNDKSCLAPTIVADTLLIQIAGKKDVVNKINQDVFTNIDLNLTQIIFTNSADSSNDISNILEENGILLGLIFVFIGGLALNLTPCVYPLIPITIGFFGGQSEGSTKRLVMMGILFVLGLAVTYSVIGVVTSLTGALFGALLQSPIVIISVALILIALSLSMFGVYEFKFPDKLVAKAGSAKGGMYGAFFMGLTLGIVAAPCIGPFVLGLVTYVASKQDPFFGFIMFFVLALGLGTPYLFLAIFSGKIKNLPRAGEWMQGVEHIFGLILVGMAIYFLLPLFPDEAAGYILPIYMILAGVFVLFFEKKAKSVKGFQIFKTIFSVLIISIAVYALIPSDTKSVAWQPYSEESVAEISNRGVIIDFYADWCIPCKELDALTFSDPEVIKVSEEFETYKADLTESLSPEVEHLREKYKIVGVPTVLILNSKGEEVERITGFVTAEEFLNIMLNVE